jgi:hypothetical protein
MKFENYKRFARIEREDHIDEIGIADSPKVPNYKSIVRKIVLRYGQNNRCEYISNGEEIIAGSEKDCWSYLYSNYGPFSHIDLDQFYTGPNMKSIVDQFNCHGLISIGPSKKTLDGIWHRHFLAKSYGENISWMLFSLMSNYDIDDVKIQKAEKVFDLDKLEGGHVNKVVAKVIKIGSQKACIKAFENLYR